MLSDIKWSLFEKSAYDKPAFMIIGAQKAGTTALFRILSGHSQLCASTKKELHYFNNHNGTEDNYRSYLKLFPSRKERAADALLFEATPAYLFQPIAAERIRAFHPQCKFIVMLRQPEQRALSAWKMYVRFTKQEGMQHMGESRSFALAIEEEIAALNSPAADKDYRAYVKRGLYAQQLKHWFSLFPREQFFIIEQTEFKKNYESCLGELQDFLGIRREALPNQYETKRQDGEESYQEELQKLRTFYAPHNESLYELLGKRFNW